MNHYSSVLVEVSHGSPSIVIELLNLSHVIAPVCRFVEKLNSRNDVGLTGVARG